MKIAVLAWATCFSSTSAQQPQPQPTFRHYTVADGLPSSEVYDVVQDSKGYVWFATDRGVSRYDGYAFKNYGVSEGLPDNTVFKVFEDYKGRIWFTSLSAQLSYFENGAIHHYQYNDVISQNFKTLYKSSFYVDKEDNIYMSVYSQGYFVISALGTIEHYKSEDEGAYHIHQIDSAAYVLSSYSISYINLVVNVHTESLNMTVGLNNVTHFKNSNCLRRKNGSFLFSGWDEMVEIRAVNDYELHTLEFGSIALYEDQEENIWLGNFEHGVDFYLPNDLSRPSRTYLKDYSVSSIMQDREGAFWFTTLEDGVFYMASNQMLTYDESSGLAQNRMGSLMSDGKGTIFAAHQSGIVQVINDSVFQEIDLPGVFKTTLYVNALMYEKEKERLHIATNRSEYLLYYLKNNRSERTTKARPTYDMVIRKSGILWGGSTGSIVCYSKGKWAGLSFAKKDNLSIHAMYEDENEVLWVGGPQGLGVYRGGTVRFNPLEKEVLNSRVTDITALENRMLCVGTSGSGVLFIEGDSIRQVDVNSGLTSNNIEQLFVDSNVIWLATNTGLNKIVFSSFEDWRYHIETYDVTDGLVSNELKDVHKLGNQIWVSSNKGLTVFDPNTVNKNEVAPPVWITGLRVVEQDTVLMNHYDFSYDQNNLVITYLGLSYKDPGKLNYRYKMEGIDSVWEYTSNTSVKYTTLPYGEYQLSISAAEANGPWSENPALVTFSIRPPWWHTWWFRILTGFLAVGAIVSILRLRENQVRAKAEAKAVTTRKIIGLELKALRAQMNPHFTFNTMNSIQHFITDKDPDAAQRYLSKFARLIRTILENSEKERITIAEELEGLTLYMELEALRFEKAFSHKIVLGQDLNPEFDRIPPMLIQPYVENAIWHGLLSKDGPGKIRIELEKWENVIKCTVEDNGVGREAAKAAKSQRDNKHKSMGMHITKERLELLSEGNIEIPRVTIIDLKNKEGHAMGTKVEILIPIK